MGRPAEAWYWEARKGWYATVGGVRHRLAGEAEGKARAKRRLAELVAATGEDGAAPRRVPTVGELGLLYLESLRHRRDAGDLAAGSRKDAVRRLADFPKVHFTLPADAIKPHHVAAWLGGHPGWGPTTRHDAVGAVKAMFSWAEKAGHIDRDPVARMEKPRRAKRRESIPKAEDVARAIESAVTPGLADLLAFIHETGCRPKEARDLEARHLDLAAGVAALAEHKTARKTGRKRVLYLSPKAAEIAGRLAGANPEGPIFRNARGRPWTKDALVLAVRRLRERTGLGPEMIAYGLRHLYITDGAARGVAAQALAELAGHSDIRMLDTYSHLGERHEALREAAAKIRGGTGAGG